MIKRLTALVFFLGLFCAVSLHAADLDVVQDGAHRMTALDAALDGSKLWVATSWGIALEEVSSGIPKPLVTLPLPGATTSVEVGTSHVYVGSGDRIFVYSRGDSSTALGAGQADGTINDLLLIEPYLYAATSKGVEQFDLLDPNQPLHLRTLITSTGFALHLARAGTTLYAADGDASVEAYTIQVPSFPQGIGSFGSRPLTQSVSEAGGRIYVSDGRRTDIWFGSGANLAQVGTISAGGNSVIASGSRFIFMAGDDRRLRAFDVAAGADPVKVFASESSPVGGSVNRMLKIVANGDKLYVAAGDAGLLTWDTSDFSSPFLVRGYETDTGNSVVAYAGGVVASLGGSGLTRFAVSEEGELSSQSSWDLSTASALHDATDTRLLVSSGGRLRRFDLTTTPPTETGSVVLATAVLSAAFRGDGNAVAVLSDRSVWSVDFGSSSATKETLGGALPLFVAGGDGDLAFAEFNEDGTTTIRYFAGGNLGASPVTAIVEGAASSGISLSAQRVACFTFRGISIADFSSAASVKVIPGSNSGIATGLVLSGANVFLLSSSSLQVWDVGQNLLARTVPLEGVATSVAHRQGEASVIVATSEGLVTVQYDSAADPPARVGTVGGANRYFRRIVEDGPTIHLWDGRDVSSSRLDTTGRPGPWRDLTPTEAAIDIAAAASQVYVITPGGEIAGYSSDGRRVTTYQVDESPDQRVLSMRAVAGALWVSMEVNCLSGGCEFRTLVLDPRGGLSKTTTLSGGAVAAIVEGSSAWAAFELPDEIRALDVTNPYQPIVTATTASTGDPVAIARDAQRGVTYTLGDRVYVYGSTLNLLGNVLAPWSPEPSGRVSYLDQRIHVVGDSAVVTGRSFSPEVYTISAPTAWFPAAVPGSRAAAVRSSVEQSGRLYLLSDYSFEIWSSAGSVSPRRRPVR